MSTTAIPRPAAGRSHRKARRTPRAGRMVMRALSTIVTGLVAVFAALMILLAVASHLSPNGQFTVFGHPVLTMLSGSMTPVIRTGDMIVDNPVTATQAEHLRVGQIVTFREAAGSTTMITHRIIAVQHGAGGTVSYVTKGDANNAPDSPARPASDVVGVFSHDIPRGGYLLNDLHSPRVLGLLAASFALFFLAGPLLRYARQPETR
jgi:signal peptidase I